MIKEIYRNFEDEKDVTFSVVVPCYNYGNFLPECIHSLHAQTFRDFEVIIVNDGSTDDSLEVAMCMVEDYQDRLRISLVNQDNAGLSQARNSGIGTARGEWICCLDADDMFPENYLEEIHRHALENEEADIIYPGIVFFGQVRRRLNPPDFGRDNLLYWNYLPYSSAYRRKVFEILGGYDTDYRLYEDWDFWLRACAEGLSFSPCRETHLLYRRHGRSMLDEAYDTKRKKLEHATHALLVVKNRALFSERDLDWAKRVMREDGYRTPGSDNVLFVVDYFPPSIGGMETFAVELGSYFIKAGYGFDVATRMIAGRSFRYYKGINIYEYDYDVAEYCDGKPKDYSELQENISRGNYRAVIAAGDPRIWVSWCVDDFELPVVMMPIINKENYEYVHRKENALLFKKFSERMRKARKVVCLSKYGYDYLLARELGIEPEVIPNAVTFRTPDISFREKYSIPEDKVLILHVGTYYPIKNQVWMIKHLARMPGNWVLAMVGRIDDRAYYEEMKKMVAGDERFMILGPLSRESVAAAMEEADLLLLPSVAESFPLVILEAMSHRLPWVASENCRGLQGVPGGRICALERKTTPQKVLKRLGAAALRNGEEVATGMGAREKTNEPDREKVLPEGFLQGTGTILSQREACDDSPQWSEKDVHPAEGVHQGGPAREGVERSGIAGEKSPFGELHRGESEGLRGGETETLLRKLMRPYYLAKMQVTRGVLHAVHLKNVLRPRLVSALRRIDEGFFAGHLSHRLVAARDAAYRSFLTRSSFMKETFRLISDPALRERLGEEGYEAWLNDYNWEVVGERYLRLIGLESKNGGRHIFMASNPVKGAPEHIGVMPFVVEETPTVSAVVLFRKDRGALEETLAGLLAQSYRNLEIVVINGSGENIAGYLRSYEDGRITCVDAEPGSNDAACFNVGIKKSSGKYLCYLREGERLYPSHCELLLERALVSSSRAVFSGAYRLCLGADTGRSGRAVKQLDYPLHPDEVSLNSDRMFPLMSLMHERALLDEHGLFDEELKGLYDWEWFLRWAGEEKPRGIGAITGEYAPGGGKFALLMEHAAYRDQYEMIDERRGGRVRKARERLKDGLFALGFPRLEGDEVRGMAAGDKFLQEVYREILAAKEASQGFAFARSLDALLEKCVENTAACHLLAMGYAEAGELLSTRALLHESLARERANAQAMADLAAVTYRLTGDHDMAETILRGALTLAPDLSRARSLRESLRREAGHLHQAVFTSP